MTDENGIDIDLDEDLSDTVTEEIDELIESNHTVSWKDDMTTEKAMTVTEALQLIEKNSRVMGLYHCILYASNALNMVEANQTKELKGQLLYVLDNMTHWRQCKTSTTTAAEIKECRAILKKASK